MAIQFGEFTLDQQECRLLRDGQPVAISPKPFDLLVALATRPGKLVSREELLREVWKDTVVEQSSLNAAMSILRQSLGADSAAIIETVPGRGYRFIARLVGETAAGGPAPAIGTDCRVVIVDDHAIVRMGVRTLFERTAGFTVAGEAGTLDDAGELIRSCKPDLLVLDLMIGDESSLPRIKDWRTAVPALRVILLSMHDEDAFARQALAAGAHGYVMKAEMTGELMAAVAKVTAGDFWVSAKLSQAIVREFADKASR